MRCERRFLAWVPPSGGMTFETRARPKRSEWVPEPYEIRHGVACQYLDDHFILDGGTDVTINAFDVLLTFEVVGCGQSPACPAPDGTR
jgi:hypothetical protein